MKRLEAKKNRPYYTMSKQKGFICQLIIIFLTLSSVAFSQDLYIPDNPFEKAPEKVKERNAFLRDRWFYEQRMYPNNFIPKDVILSAQRAREQLQVDQGFYSNSRNSDLVSVSWENIGPSPGYYFSYGNISSRIVTIQYDPINPDIIYLGAAFGGIWKSTDAGNTWVPKTDDEISLSSGSIAIDPTNTNTIYYGTGEATYSAVSYYGRGLLKSSDGGTTWTNFTNGLPSLAKTSRIVIRPNHSNELLAALGYDGLYRSTDSGENWTQALSGRCDDIIFSPSGDTAYTVGSGVGYRISFDGGSTFTSNAALSPGSRNHIALCKSFPNILYFASYSSGSIQVFKSTDSGNSFTQVSSGTNFRGHQSWYNFYMHVNPTDPNYAYVGSIDIWRTTNGGTSFQNITNGYAGGSVHVDQHNLAFHPTNADQMMSVNDGGIWRSTDRGSTWANLNATLTLTQFYRIASDPSNGNHVIGGTQDNGTQRTLGTANWSSAFSGDGGEICFHSQNSNYILGETQNNGVRRSTDNGTTWLGATSGLSGSGAWVGPLISHPADEGVFYTARQLIFKTTNWGASWNAISSGTSGTIRELAISKTSPNIMYATYSSQIFKSTDSGTSFSNVSSGLPSRVITSVYVHPMDSEIVFITLSSFESGHIYKSTNGAASWQNISGNLPDSPANDVLILPNSNHHLIATDVGVYLTENDGITWIELAEGLPNTVAIHLDYNPTSDEIFVGTHGRGVFKIDASTLLPAPKNLVAGNGFDGMIPLTWDRILSTAIDTVNYYNVYRSETSGGPYALVGNTSAPVQVWNYVDNTITNGNSYYYVVTALYTDGDESGYSSEVNAAPIANGMHITSLHSLAAPTNDGTINSLEWSDSYSIDIRHPGVPQPITLYMMIFPPKSRQ
jgi:photosystem II stability/assembly factor-like uncharacterized protein